MIGLDLNKFKKFDKYLDEIIKTKIDEDKAKIGTPEYIEDGGNLLYEPRSKNNFL